MSADITYHGVVYRREHQSNTHTYFTAPLSGCVVTLYDTDGTSLLATDTTDAYGAFDFSSVTATSTTVYLGFSLANYFSEYKPLVRIEFTHEVPIYGAHRLIPCPSDGSVGCLIRCRVVSYTTDSTGSYNWRPSTTGSMTVQLLSLPATIASRQAHPQLVNISSLTAVSNSDGEIDAILAKNSVIQCTVSGYKYVLNVEDNIDITTYVR